MIKLFLKWIGFLALCCAVHLMTANETLAWSHYVPGAVGVKNGSVPPPGRWFVNYNCFYAADTTKDDSGNTVAVPSSDIFVYANVSQIAWMTEKKILGADYGVDIFFPFAYTDLKVDAAGMTVLDEDTFGLGDIFIDPLILAWHARRWDAFVAAGAYIPTGDHDDATSPGKGYWTFMEQVGGTYYFDEARTWTIAARARFEQSTKDDDTDVTPGDELIFEYGFGKDFSLGQKMLATVGLAGYSYTQLSADSGPDEDGTKFSGHGLGPEVQLTIFKPFVNLSLRYLVEYGVENKAQGENICLAITTSFF